MSGHTPGDQLDLDGLTAMHEDRRYSDEFLGRLARTATVPALVAEVRRLRALSARLREQLQHECPHGEMSWSGADQTPLEDPAKDWVCDNCGKLLDDAARRELRV